MLCIDEYVFRVKDILFVNIFSDFTLHFDYRGEILRIFKNRLKPKFIWISNNIASSIEPNYTETLSNKPLRYKQFKTDPFIAYKTLMIVIYLFVHMGKQPIVFDRRWNGE